MGRRKSTSVEKAPLLRRVGNFAQARSSLEDQTASVEEVQLCE